MLYRIKQRPLWHLSFSYAISNCADIRLISSSKPNSGVVEVHTPGQGWGIICKENGVWNLNLASSVCGYLNLPGTSMALSALDFNGDGTSNNNNNIPSLAILNNTQRAYSCSSVGKYNYRDQPEICCSPLIETNSTHIQSGLERMQHLRSLI